MQISVKNRISVENGNSVTNRNIGQKLKSASVENGNLDKNSKFGLESKYRSKIQIQKHKFWLKLEICPKYWSEIGITEISLIAISNSGLNLRFRSSDKDRKLTRLVISH